MSIRLNNMRRWGFSVLLSFIVLQLLLSSCTLGKDEREVFAAAKSSFESGDYSKATIELKQLLQINPENSDARQLLARTHLKKGDGVSAEKEIKRVLNNKPPNADTQLILLTSWELQGKQKEILDAYEKGTFDTVDPMTLWGVVSHSYLSEKDLKKGTDLANKMLEQDSNSTIALRTLAIASMLRGDHSEALGYLQHALEIDKNDYKVHRYMGDVYAQLEDHDKAVDKLKEALSLMGESGDARDEYAIKTDLVHLLLHLNRQDESGEYIKELDKKYKKSPYVNYLAGLHSYLNQDYESAATKLTRAQSGMPDHLQTILLLGATHFSKKNLEQANVLLTRYVNEVPTHLQARKLLGEIKLRLNKPKEALVLLESDDVGSNDKQILTMIGLAASQSGEYSKGIEFLKRAAHENPSDTRIREELARLYINHGEFNEAIAELEDEWVGESSRRDNLLILSYIKKQDFVAARKLSDQVLSRGKTPADLHVRALIELNSGNRHKARDYFTQAVNENPELFSSHLALARMDLEDGELIEGSDRLNLVLAGEPDNISAMMLLAQISERLGNREEALTWLEKAATTNEKSWLPRVILGRYHLRRNEPEKAAAYLDSKIFRESTNPAVLSLLATVDKQTGRYTAAESKINKLLVENPTSEIAYLQMADIQSKRGDLTAVRKTLQKLDKEVPSSLKGKLFQYKLEMMEKNYQRAEEIIHELQENEGTRLLGISLKAKYHAALGDLEKAINSLEIHASSESPFSFIQQLSDLYIKNNDSVSAINLLKKWEKTHQDNDQVKLALAIAYQTAGDPDNAMLHYSKLLEKNPKNIVALNNSAILSFEKDPQKAIEQAKLAYEITGNTVHSVVDTYAWMIHQSGDTASALKVLIQIIDKVSDPSILYHYAVMLAVSGEEIEAEKILTTITKKHAEFPEVEEAKKLLSEFSQIKG